MSANPHRDDTTDDPRLEPGTILAGRYRIGELLGEGGVGAVYYAEHTVVGRPVAIKVLSERWAGNRVVATRFRAEARAASAAGHPNIIDVLDAGELPDGRPYIAMEYLGGRQLWEEFQAQPGNRLPVPRACRILRDVARAVAAAHAVGIIHRDLKSENVMLASRNGQDVVKVLDFGIASGVSDLMGRSTTPGTIMGTPAYMSPEQAAGAPASEAFDIYALGVLLHEALTGHVPFEHEQPLQTLVLKSSGPAPSVATLGIALPEPLVALVDQCLAFEAAERPCSASLVAERLQAILDAPAVVVLPTVSESEPAPAGHWSWSRWAVGLLLVGATVAGWMLTGLTEPTAAIAVADVRPPATESAVPPTPEPSVPVEPAAVEPAAVEPAAVEPAAVEPAAVEPAAVEPAASVPHKKATRQRASVATKAPKPTPKPEPEPVDCNGVQPRARAARAASNWEGVLEYTRHRECWRGSSERQKLRTKAYMEQGRFDACAKTGKGSSDPETQTWLKICEKRSAG